MDQRFLKHLREEIGGLRHAGLYKEERIIASPQQAKIRLEELSPLVSEMCRHYAIPSQEFHGVYDGIENEFLGHIAGGIDREGRDFLTIYYGVEGH